MGIIKCKMCGGDLDIKDDSTIAKCRYCGSVQTVPKHDNERKMALFERANRLRFANEFDKAYGVYEIMVSEFPTEAESYWGLFLCKYGIEYVDDPSTGKKIPTCHRLSFDCVMDDENLDMACENADVVSCKLYRNEAKTIEKIRKDIIEISGKEEPYDVFICYKETDESGNRTLDSVIAQDVYDALIQKGYRVFFSRITLEDKLGQEYEPYIFAALQSAKIMLVFGTDYEYFNAVWVKNEWSRFLKLISCGAKKTIIPCYKNIDVYDMPKEFYRLQSQDMSKIGAIQDLLRCIEKIIPKYNNLHQEIDIVQTSHESIYKPLLERGYMFLDERNWKRADEYFEKVLDLHPKCAWAYLGKLMVSLKFSTFEDFNENNYHIEEDDNFIKAINFADDKLKNQLNIFLVMKDYNNAKQNEFRAKTYDEYMKIKSEYESISGYKDADQRALECEQKAKKIGEEIEKATKEAEKIKKKLEQGREKANKMQKFIAVHGNTVIGLKTDGTAMVTGNNGYDKYNISDWVNIVAIACGIHHAVGLKVDNMVVATGKNDSGQCNISEWFNIVAVACGAYHTVGLKLDGTVISVGNNEYGQCNVCEWSDIVAVACGAYHTVGLKLDGTVVAVGYNVDGECDVSEWSDIVAIVCGTYHTVGLKSNKMVVATGYNEDRRCNVSNWSDVVAIAGGDYHTIALKSDGTVMATGDNEYGECNISNWSDIVAVAGGLNFTVGLKNDGVVVAVGDIKKETCNVFDWKLFNNIDTIEDEFTNMRRLAEERRMEEERLIEEYWIEEEQITEECRKRLEAEKLRQENMLLELQKELLEFHELFNWKQKREIKNEMKKIQFKLNEIEERIN